jgi:hypothetical protein
VLFLPGGQAFERFQSQRSRFLNRAGWIFLVEKATWRKRIRMQQLSKPL